MSHLPDGEPTEEFGKFTIDCRDYCRPPIARLPLLCRSMPVVDDFIARYRREYDFYDQAARLVAQLLDARLQAAGVRAMVTSRAKAVGSLDKKVRDRAQAKNYASVDDIYADIPDLAGARVALYFPGQREQVGLIVQELFVVVQEKVFPDENSSPKYDKRFSGYYAAHYRVRLRETTLVDAQKRYAEARVEIQVASVLMHAWAEVEHDLVYKPHQGKLSEDEYAILDELNGMVLAGEIALERLQRAGSTRVAAQGRRFENHFELAAYLLSELHELTDKYALQAGLGPVDVLFALLDELKLSTPDALGKYLAVVHADLERRPIAEQIIDQLLSEDATRYSLYQRLRKTQPSTEAAPEAAEPVTPDAHEAMGAFLANWIDVERLLREITAPFQSGTVTLRRMIKLVPTLDEETVNQFERLRRLRNNLVHGVEIPDPMDLREAARQLDRIRKRIVDSLNRGTTSLG